MKTLPLGSVTTNPMSRQMLTICLALLADVAPKTASGYQSKELLSRYLSGEDTNARGMVSVRAAINGIMRDLNRHVPPFCYFGHHPTDPNHIGVWIDLDALHKAENSGKVSQFTGSWRGVKSAYVLDMTGNGLVLYRRRGKQDLWRIA